MSHPQSTIGRAISQLTTTKVIKEVLLARHKGKFIGPYSPDGHLFTEIVLQEPGGSMKIVWDKGMPYKLFHIECDPTNYNEARLELIEIFDRTIQNNHGDWPQ